MILSDHVLSDNRVDMTYRFITPSVEEAPAGTDRLFFRYRISRGISVLKYGTSYIQKRWPTQNEVDDADVAYIGGHEYDISLEEADSLVAAGYRSNVFGPTDIFLDEFTESFL